MLVDGDAVVSDSFAILLVSVICWEMDHLFTVFEGFTCASKCSVIWVQCVLVMLD